MNNFAYIIANDHIFINFGDGSKPKTIFNNSKNYDLVRKFLLEKGHNAYKDIKKVLEPEIIEIISDGKFKLIDYNGTKKILYEDMVISNKMSNYIIEYYVKGYSYKHLINFFNNIMDIPKTYSNRNGDTVRFEHREETINDIFDFITKYHYPITEDGCVIADRMVKSDMGSWSKSIYDNKRLFYYPGTIVELPRSECDHNRNHTCSAGIHVRNWGYNLSIGDRKIYVKFNPRDIVSIPYENCEKMRVCRVEVLPENYQSSSLNLKDSFIYNSDEQKSKINENTYLESFSDEVYKAKIYSEGLHKLKSKKKGMTKNHVIDWVNEKLNIKLSHDMSKGEVISVLNNP